MNESIKKKELGILIGKEYGLTHKELASNYHMKKDAVDYKSKKLRKEGKEKIVSDYLRLPKEIHSLDFPVNKGIEKVADAFDLNKREIIEVEMEISKLKKRKLKFLNENI